MFINIPYLLDQYMLSNILKFTTTGLKYSQIYIYVSDSIRVKYNSIWDMKIKQARNKLLIYHTIVRYV